ncbi:MAG: type II toxin-antitoxin system RelE/ParE family toxin [Hyphomicrobiales bacterium]
MSPARYTHRARDDLLDIWIQIAANDESMANRILDTIAMRCARLADFPELGPARPDIAPETKMLVIERWISLYRLLPGGVQIIRIVDGARDLTRLELPRS